MGMLLPMKVKVSRRTSWQRAESSSSFCPAINNSVPILSPAGCAEMILHILTHLLLLACVCSARPGESSGRKKLSVRRKLLPPSPSLPLPQNICAQGNGCWGPSSKAKFLEILFYSQTMVASLVVSCVMLSCCFWKIGICEDTNTWKHEILVLNNKLGVIAVWCCDVISDVAKVFTFCALGVVVVLWH